jgi:hypothetical protein
VRVIHVAQGGTPLVNAAYMTPSWHPDRRGEMYDRLLAAARRTLESVCDAGGEPRVEAFFWMQGEQDTKTDNTGPEGQSLPPPPQPQAAEAYAENLKALLAAVRRDLARADLPVIIADTPVGAPPDYVIGRSKHAMTPVVVAAQAAVASSDPRAALVSTARLERAADRLHLTPDSAAELARAMVQTWWERFG